MGYARTSQVAHGIHQRLRARAFIMAEPQNANTQERVEGMLLPEEEDEVFALRRNQRREKDYTGTRDTSHGTEADPDKTVCFVSIDAGMGSDLLNVLVLERLQSLIPGQGGKPVCHLENLVISGTHTHSAPGGFLQYALFQLTSLGYSHETMEAYVEGVTQALLRAYRSLQPGSIEVAQDLLTDASVNRSPSSYLLNPPEERAEYEPMGDTDKTMLQITLTSDKGERLGALNWFAVHGTSMNASNLLLSGDNKGYASYLMEKHYGGNETLPGKGAFVAAFASTNLGDVSPNTAGPRCLDTGMPCDFEKSTCNGKTQTCVAFGPGKDMVESTEIIGRRQYELAVRLAERATDSLNGAVAFRHSFVDMSSLNVTLESGQVVRTCPAALGYSFAAGTTDGPGDFDFTQGSNSSNPFWNMMAGFLSDPTQEQIECHAPKPILLNTGYVAQPYEWDPNTIPISISRIGQLFILSVPAEFTTMAGRRLRKAVRKVLVDGGIADPVITIAGLANSYSHYVTTREEYAGQRYEAASTLYGPHTLSAYIQEFQRIAANLIQGLESESGKAPSNRSAKQVSLIPPVVMDTIGWGKKFGSAAVDARDVYHLQDTVIVSFHSANPRNNLQTEDTFLTVDAMDNDGNWHTRYVDGDWCTTFHWKGGIGYFGESFAEIHWTIPVETPIGLYRLCHRGSRKTVFGNIEAWIAYVPSWARLGVVGSYAVHLAIGVIDLILSLSGTLRRETGKLSLSKLRDFEGCSRTFLVTS